MPIRLTVGRLMLVVALLAVVLAAGRVHVSLGSLAFGILAIAWVRTARWAEQQRADGAEVGRLELACDFITSLAFAAARLTFALVPALVVFFVTYGVASGGQNHYRPGYVMLAFAAVAGGLAGAASLRLIRKP